MKKIYCNPTLFDLHQKIYIVDEAKNKVDCIAITNMTELPKALASISSDYDIPWIEIECADAIWDGIALATRNYFNKFYSNNNQNLLIAQRKKEEK